MPAFQYTKINVPDVLAISVADVKEHLKIPASNTDSDDYIEALIKAATLLVEKYIKRELITKTFRTYRDYLVSSCYIQLRRSKVQAIDSISYYKDGSLTVIDSSLYSFTDSVSDWSNIYLVDYTSTWPTDSDKRPQAVLIEFQAGYGPDDSYIPDDIKQALKLIIACLYYNRGDCIDCETIDGPCFDARVKALLGQYRIKEVSL